MSIHLSKERTMHTVFTGAALLTVILLFTILDHALHGLQDRWSVPDYYFRNKIPYGFLWAVVGLYLCRRWRSVWARALVVAGVVSVTLQFRYFIEGYPLDFVFIFLLVHFVILAVLLAGMFRVLKSVELTQTIPMKKTLIVIVVLAVVAIAAYMLVFKGSSPSAVYPTPTPSVSMTSTPTATPKVTPTTSLKATVDIKNFAFNPTTLTVKVGTRVTWTNNDTVAHFVISDSGMTLSSGTMAPGQTYSVTFTTPGTTTYHCNIHPSMIGTVVVTP
jgi:plastocyanin